MPVYACIIPTFNRPAWTVEAVESVLAQTLGDFECIVVDDGSTDDTADRIVAVGDPRVRLVRQPHRGVAAARNHGVAMSSSPWLAFLDSDDRWLPRKMERQMAFVAANTALRISQTDELWIRRGVRVNPMKKHRKSGGDLFARSLELCVISPSAVLVARSLFDEIGGFDEDFPVCEDYDLWLRITCREVVGFLPEPLVVKRGGHDDQLSRSAPVMDHYRIRAIDKILRSGQLNETQQHAAVDELARKCKIVALGCRKHGKNREAERYLALARQHREALAGVRRTASAKRAECTSDPVS
jgi:glycosyltransferase involved in cell wall biosynthesis